MKNLFKVVIFAFLMAMICGFTAKSKANTSVVNNKLTINHVNTNGNNDVVNEIATVQLDCLMDNTNDLYYDDSFDNIKSTLKN